VVASAKYDSQSFKRASVPGCVSLVCAGPAAPQRVAPGSDRSERRPMAQMARQRPHNLVATSPQTGTVNLSWTDNRRTKPVSTSHRRFAGRREAASGPNITNAAFTGLNAGCRITGMSGLWHRGVQCWFGPVGKTARWHPVGL